MNTRTWLGVGFAWMTGYVLSACGGSDIDPPYRVNTFRVMAVSASRPYVHPGETVTLSALQYDPLGRAIHWAWLPCPEAWLVDYRSCVEHLPAPSDYRRWVQYTSTPSVTFTLPPIPFAESKAGKVSPMQVSTGRPAHRASLAVVWAL